MNDYDGERLLLESGEVIPTRTVLWSAGVRAASLMSKLGVEQDRIGRVRVLPTLQLPGLPDVYVIGDAAYLEENGKPLPMVAQVAMQQGRHAAHNILADIQKKPLQPFRYVGWAAWQPSGAMPPLPRPSECAFAAFWRGWSGWWFT